MSCYSTEINISSEPTKYTYQANRYQSLLYCTQKTQIIYKQSMTNMWVQCSVAKKY